MVISLYINCKGPTTFGSSQHKLINFSYVALAFYSATKSFYKLAITYTLQASVFALKATLATNCGYN